MAQNVTIAGASYTDVTAIEVPKTTSGTASFHDVSDTTATASDVAQGKYFYTADGVKTVGTSLPATITETLDANGGYVLEVTGGLDLSNDTVTAERLLSGYTAHDRSGTAITGTATNPVPENDVIFIDYDGTILYSYTAHEFDGLTSMPSNPTHTGLTAQGWNWSLAQIKAQLTSAPTGDVWVGQMYITDDGKNRIYIHIVDKALCSMRLNFAVNGTVTVDWGDNTAAETVTGTSLATRIQTEVHTYSSIGDYVITLNVVDGNMDFYADAGCGLISHITSTSGPQNRAFSSMVYKVEIGDSTGIGAGAFYNCFSLDTITIPNSATYIGNDAFRACHSLRSITIPSGVTSLASYTAYECFSLGSISLPYSVTSIGESAISNCQSLGSITIPSGVTDIGATAFSQCHSLRSVTIPSGIMIMGSGVFRYCYSLTSITIPSGVTSIISNTFYNCYSLASINIPDSVTSIGAGAFYNCSSLNSITIPNGVTSIGDTAFYGCLSLNSINIPSGVTSIGSSAFYNCYSLNSINIPSGVTSIGSSAFYNCYALGSINIPSGVTTISNSAFYNCRSLNSITIPSGITSLFQNVFYSCYSVGSITIPSSVTSIGYNALAYCSGLQEIHFERATPPTISNKNAFSSLPTYCKIYVPTGSLTAYATATNYPSSSTYTYIEE